MRFHDGDCPIRNCSNLVAKRHDFRLQNINGVGATFASFADYDNRKPRAEALALTSRLD